MNYSGKILLSTLFSCLTLPLQGAQVMQQQDWGPVSPAFNSATSGSLSALTFNQFNPSLGTLNFINVVTFVEFDQGNASVDAEGTLLSDITVEFGVDVDYTSPDVTLSTAAFETIGQGVQAFNSETFTDVGANDGDDVLTFQGDGGDDNRTMAVTQVTASDSGNIAPGLFAQYTGTGTFDIEYEGTSLFNISSTGSTSGSFGPGIAQGFVIVTYDYIPAIPEPSTALCLLAGAALFARRRRN
ncbi:MAG: choice-of-anchor E domain-containing protein [Verrucomicrobiota bacterium]